LKASGVKGGLVVQLGCGDSTLTASLRADDSFLVQGLDTDPANVQLSRAHIQSLDLGGVVTARVFDGKPDFPGQHLISALATAFISRTFSLR
jgi:2-polyprenyl-3-methyl-5-hydroxy-6-metoxy-1,4-benzoquinol methylase